jgi:hypothetical protein
MPTTAITSTQILDSGLTGRELIQAADQAAAQAIIGVDPSQYGLLSANNTWTGFNTFQDDLIASFISSASIDATGSISVSEDLEVQGSIIANGAEFSGEVEFTSLITGVGGEHQGDLTISQTADMIVTGGGGYKLYNIGTEGDTDTEYLETSFASNIATIETKSTGAGGNRGIYMRSAGIHRLYVGGSLVWNNSSLISEVYTSIKPAGDGARYCGQDGNRWANVASVDGNFTGTVTTPTITGGASGHALTLGSTLVAESQIKTATGGGTALAWGHGGSGTYIYSAVQHRFVGGIKLQGDAISEVGTSYKLYNLGTEGDTDTEALVVSADGTTYDIFSTITGTGAHRRIDIGGFDGAAYRGLRLDTANGILEWQYNNATKFRIDSSTAKISSTTTVVNDLRPSVTDVSYNGTTSFRWANVASVDGDFSNTVTALNVTGVNNLYLQNSVDTASMSLAGSGGVTIRAHNAIMQQFTPTGVNYRVDCIPTFDGNTNLGLTTNRWGNVASVDGSFSGNLTTEVGGSYRLYSLGTDGDTDTEYLETSFDTTEYLIAPKRTGAGSPRAFEIQGCYGALFGNINFDIFGFLNLGYGQTPSISCRSGGAELLRDMFPNITYVDTLSLGKSTRRFGEFYSIDGDFSGTVTADTIDSTWYQSGGANMFLTNVNGIQAYTQIIPSADGLWNVGLTTRRFGGIHGVDGSFSGNLNTEVGGIQKFYNLGTEGDTDTEFVSMAWDTNDFKMQTDKTGVGTVQDFDIAGKQVALRHNSGTSISTRLSVDSNSVKVWRNLYGGTDGLYSCGIASNRWSNVASVDGDFSGAVSIGAYTLDNNGNGFRFDYAGTKVLEMYSDGRVLTRASTATSSVGISTLPFGNVYSIDGSFSGNLVSEVGGSPRIYNLGTDGDTDTEYLDISWQANNCKFKSQSTGTGVERRLDFEGSGIRYIAAGITVADISAGDIRLYSGRTIRPLLDNDASVGKTGQRFTNVYSYAGDFSGTVTAPSVFNSNGGTGITINPNDIRFSRVGQGEQIIMETATLRPIGNDVVTLGNSSNRWSDVYSVDGSFSGNLVSEAGGTYKLYNLGTEGDADTEYLEMAWTGSGASSKGIIAVGSTGAGASRELILAGNSFRIRGAGGVGDRFYVDANSILFQIDGKVSNGVNFRPTTVTASNTSDLGLSAYRWRNIFGVNGDFSGTVTAVDGSFSGNLVSEAGGTYKLYNLGTEGDTDTEYLETSWSSNYAMIQNKATGAGVARGIKLMTDSATDGLEINNGSMQFFVSNDAKMQVLGNGVNTVNLNPKSTNTYSLGSSANRWQTAVTNGLAVGVQTVNIPTATALNAGRGVTLCDCTTTPITVPMPAAATLTGQMLWIKKIDSTSNAVTIDGNGSETIDGAASITLTSQYQSITLVSDGTNWFIV